MFVVKLAGGIAFHSQAMVADAWHSFSDLGSDLLTWLTVTSSLRPPNAQYPLGFGKVESLGALGVSGMLLFSGCYMFLGSSQALMTMVFPEAQELLGGVLGHVHSHSHSHSHAHGGAPSMNAAWLAAATVAVKEWLYQASEYCLYVLTTRSNFVIAMKVAKERKSAVLASNAVHHRVDSLTGIVTLLAVVGANFLHNAAWLDPLGGFVISLLVIKAGWGNTVSALYELVDKSIDEEIKSSVSKQVKKAIANLSNSSDIELREVEGIKSGQNYLIDLLVAVPRSWTLVETTEVEDGLRTAVGSKVRGVRRVKIRFVPKEDSETSLFDEFIPGDVSPRGSPEPEDHDHDHDHDHHHHDHTHTNGSGKKSQ